MMRVKKLSVNEMGKSAMKILKPKNAKDQISAEARVSLDRRQFTLRLEGGKPYSWQDFLHLVMDWADREFKDLERKPDDKTH